MHVYSNAAVAVTSQLRPDFGLNPGSGTPLGELALTANPVPAAGRSHPSRNFTPEALLKQRSVLEAKSSPCYPK